MGPFTNVGQAGQTKEMNPCRRALKDLMKELLISIPEVLLARDSALLNAYNAGIDALAADDLWEKQMQGYMQLTQQQMQKPIYIQPPFGSPNTAPTWTTPNTTSGGHQQ